MSAGNPIIGGLMQALQFKSAMQHQQMQRQQLELAIRREERQQQLQKADLQMRLNDLGARPYTPSDELESQIGMQMDYGEGAVGMGGFGVLPSFKPSTLKERVMDLGKDNGKWVLPSEEDREARLDRRAKRETDRDVAKTTAVEKVRGDSAVRVARDGTRAREEENLAGEKARREAFGWEVPGMGLTVMPNEMSGVTSLMDAMNPDRIISSTVVQGGNGVFEHNRTRGGKTETRQIPGVTPRPVAPHRDPSALTPHQQEEKNTATKAGELLQKHGGDVSKAEEEARKTGAVPVAEALKKIAPKAKKFEEMTPEEQQAAMQRILGGSSGKAAPAAKPSKGKLSGATIRAYAIKHRIDYPTALRKAKSEGYETPE